MSSLLRWLNWEPAPKGPFSDTRSSTKPTEPTKPVGGPAPTGTADSFVGFEGFVAGRDEARGHNQASESSAANQVDGRAAVPRWGRTVDVWFLGRATKLTVAHHNLAGANRFAQAATEFPY